MDTHSETRACPACGQDFPFRSNRTFCSPKCRKDSSQKKRRAITPANAANSPSKRREQAELFELAMLLAAQVYSINPNLRMEWMRDLVNRGRSGKDPKIRQILTMPRLLTATHHDKHLFYRRCPRNYVTIAQAANRYCNMMWGAGVVDVVRGVVPELETGEVF